MATCAGLILLSEQMEIEKDEIRKQPKLVGRYLVSSIELTLYQRVIHSSVWFNIPVCG